MTVLSEHPLRTYPLPSPEADPRFSGALVEVVADLLHESGYPFIAEESGDMDALAAALHGFLHRTTVHRPE